MNARKLILVCSITSVVTLLWVSTTPSTAIPVGLTVAEGTSMGEDKDSNLIIYEGFSEPGVDDVVLYYSEKRDEYIHHRIVDESSEGYITQGDALPQTDVAYGREHVTSENYVGKVVVSI